MDGTDVDGREIRVQFARYGRASTTDGRDKSSSSTSRRRRYEIKYLKKFFLYIRDSHIPIPQTKLIISIHTGILLREDAVSCILFENKIRYWFIPAGVSCI
jgi:hypothetical protein